MMAFAFWVLIFSIPGFFLYGVYKAIVPYSQKDQQKILRKFFDQLKKTQANLTHNEQEAIDVVSHLLMREHLLDETTALQVAPKPTVQPREVPQQKPDISTPQGTSVDVSNALHSLENINILLYVGAFLLIVASSLFATYSYSFLSPTIKTALLFVFSSLFYFGGLALYTQTQRVKPAGLVFTVIGLLTQPLIGLATYNFIFSGLHGYLIWFVTSGVCLVSYVVAYILMKKNFLAYLITLSVLSTIVSFLLFQALPTYAVMYTVCIVSMVYLIFSRQKHLPQDISQALYLTSFITLPLALVFSLTLIDEYEVFAYTAANFALGALYYTLGYALTFVESKEKIQFLGVSAFLVPVSLVIFLFDAHLDFFSWQMAFFIVLISIFYAVVAEIFSFFQKGAEAHLFAIGAGLLSVVSILLVFEKASVLIFFAIFCAVINAYLTQRFKNIYSHLFGIIGYLSVPVAISRYLGYDLFSVYTGVLYSVTTVILYAKRYLYKEHKEFAEISFLSILVSFCVSLIFSQAEFGYLVLFAYFLQCVFLFFASYLENNPGLVALATALVYLAAFRVFNFWRLDQDLLSLGVAFVSLAIYFSATLFEQKRREILILAGIFGMVLASVYGFDLETKTFVPQIALILASLLCSYESTKRQIVSGERLGIAGVLASVQWMIYSHLSIYETHVYALMWSAYFAYIAYLEQDQNRQNFTVLSLVCATVPIGLKGLESELHGLFLLFQSIPMLFVGIILKNKTVKYWSIGVLIIEVLYYMRKFLLDLPGWAIFGILGVTVLFTGVYLLTRRKED